MQNNFFEEYSIDGIQIITINSEIEQVNIEKAFHLIEKSIKENIIILDLQNVSFVNSTFIGYLYHLFETSKNSGRIFTFANGQDAIMDAFNLTGVLDLIPYFKKLDDAIEKYRKEKII